MASSYTFVAADVFAQLGREVLGRRETFSNSQFSRRFRSLFGVSPQICEKVWLLLSFQLPSGSSPKHLLWALLFLKVYGTEHLHSSLCGVDEKTFRNWSWAFVKLLSELPVIKWERRIDRPFNHVYKVSVDGTDCPIREPQPFSLQWYSHKFKGAGLRYEVGVTIHSGEICWVHGPFACGSYPDKKIYCLKMKRCLLHGEMVVGDAGYIDLTCSHMDNRSEPTDFSFIRARHEATNKRIKQFAVLTTRFRHKLHLHSFCFHAAANLTQLMIQHGEPVFIS